VTVLSIVPPQDLQVAELEAQFRQCVLQVFMAAFETAVWVAAVALLLYHVTDIPVLHCFEHALVSTLQSSFVPDIT
jgi:hypothetical protein